MLNKSDGFTLLEFLVATVILSVGLLGLLQSINLAMSTNVDSALRSGAVMLADDLMMQQRAKAFDEISTTTVNTCYQQNVRGIYKNYSVQQVVTQPTASTNSKQIDITVAWTRKSKRSTHSTSSIVSIFPK